jgi:hypothetical protein
MVHAESTPEDAALAHAIDKLSIDMGPDKNKEVPLVVTASMVCEQVTNDKLKDVFGRGGRAASGKMDRAGYTAIRNPDRKKDGFWKVYDSKEPVTVYALKSLSSAGLCLPAS